MTRYAQRLEDLAAEIDIHARRFPLPLDVVQFCSVNHLPLDIEPRQVVQGAGKRSPPAELHRSATGGYRIILRKESSAQADLSPLERFFVAHEVAHVLIDRKTGWLPEDRGEYFEREKWCDRLAGHLLVPTASLEGERAALQSSQETGNAINRLSRMCNVPRKVVALRASKLLAGHCFFLLERTARKNGTPVWRVSWIVGDAPSIPLTQRRMFEDKNSISLLARAATDARGAAVTATDVVDGQLVMQSLPGERVLGWHHRDDGIGRADRDGYIEQASRRVTAAVTPAYRVDIRQETRSPEQLHLAIFEGTAGDDRRH